MRLPKWVKRRSRKVALAAAGFLLMGAAARRSRAAELKRFKATAYAQRGVTRSGQLTHKGTAAADPRVLPLGSVIQVEGAGEYSGVYTVTDTGSKVKGRHIDLWVPERDKARQFGERRVLVKVLKVAGAKQPPSA